MGLVESLLEHIHWTRGRGIGGYDKYKLFESKLFKCDAYLLYYRQGSQVKPHYDKAPLDDHEHHRVNIELVRPEQGGSFKYVKRGDKTVWFGKHRVVRFRPDEVRHWITPIARGYRLVLSFGWLQRR